jgi:hypothetical protein
MVASTTDFVGAREVPLPKINHILSFGNPSIMPVTRFS